MYNNKILLFNNNFMNKNFLSFNNNNNLINNNNINNNNNNFKPPKPISLFLKPTLIGLVNIGSTCFMNATLQAFSQTKDLTNYFLDEEHWDRIKNNNIALRNKNDLQLVPAYLELLKNLWDKNNEKGNYAPRNFMETVEAMNPLFKLGQAGDAKDFIIFFLEQLHKELKNFSNNDNNDDQVNQYDQQKALYFFLENFKNQASKISDIFYGIQENTNICLYCKNNYSSQGQPFPINYNYQVFNCLIFPLEEVRKMKNQNNLNKWPNNDEVSLDDCFNYDQRIEHFTGDNRSYCKICQQLWDSDLTTKIYSCPNVLILVLNRGKHNIYKVKLNFEETIEITKYVTLKKGKVFYNLTGVITHIGQSGPFAHFLAFCKSPINDKWYEYNDSIVTDVKDVKKEIIDFGNPYVLFYKKVDQNKINS